MSSELNDKSESERLHNKTRFTHTRYQLKGSTGNNGQTHSMLNTMVLQENGLYAYPKDDVFQVYDPPVVPDPAPHGLIDLRALGKKI